MNSITPIIDLDIPCFVGGKPDGSIVLERGVPVPVTILRRYRGMVDLVIEDEDDKPEVRRVSLDHIQLH